LDPNLVFISERDAGAVVVSTSLVPQHLPEVPANAAVSVYKADIHGAAVLK